MESQNIFVQCTYEPGIFDNEYAVEIHPGGTESLSLFAWKKLVRQEAAPNKGLLEAQLLEHGDGYDVVILPSEALEIGKSIVKLPSRLVTAR